MEGISAFILVVFWNLFMLGIFWLLFDGIPQLFKSDNNHEESKTKYETNNFEKSTSSPKKPDCTKITSESSSNLKEGLEETHKRERHRVQNLSKDKPSTYISPSQQAKKTHLSKSSISQKFQKSSPLKESIKSILKRNGIDTFYHFTDKANLDSIRKHGGLYSWEYCDKNNIAIARPGGNQLSRYLDSRKNLGNYVRLSFKREIPMLHTALRDGRLQNPFILEIDPQIILWKNTLFCDGNATSSRSNIGNKLSHFKTIRFDILNQDVWTSEEEKFYWQAEILVKEHLPLKFIKNL